MSILSKDKDILEFIDNKRLSIKQLDIVRSYKLCCKTVKNALILSYKENSDIEYSIICSDIIFNIYWTLLFHTYNLKLTMFLCDRAIILYNEYITMLKTAIQDNLLDDKKMNIKITDVKLFIYNKTVGPIVLDYKNNNKQSKKLSQLCTGKNVCYQLKMVIQYIFKKYYNLDYNNQKDLESISFVENPNFDIIVDTMISYYVTRMFKLHINMGEKIVLDFIYDIFVENDDFFKEKNTAFYINQFKLRLDIAYRLLEKVKDITKVTTLLRKNYIMFDTADCDSEDLEKLYSVKSILYQNFYKDMMNKCMSIVESS